MMRMKEEMRAAAAQAENERVDALMKAITPIGQYEEAFNAARDARLPRISTGYPELDRVLTGGLVNELYIMGAETSTGKSAFLMSIAQNIAASGIDVLYFSMEMGKEELVARGISAISYERWDDARSKGKADDQRPKQFTAAQILYWVWDNILHDYTQVPRKSYAADATEYFRRYGGHLHIIEGSVGGGLTVYDIVQMSKRFKAQSGKTPVVFIDYLQIIHPAPDDSPDRKTRMDTIVTTLKGLASQVGMPVFALSSVGRTQYGHKVSKESFKESGDVEYTGGILCGWNWLGVTNSRNPFRKFQEMQDSKIRGFRKMRFEVLKYRNAEIASKVDFCYYPAYNYFKTPEVAFVDMDDADIPNDFKKGKTTKNAKKPPKQKKDGPNDTQTGLSDLFNKPMKETNY